MKYTDFLWDFDGTLMDTYPHVASAFEAVMIRDSIPFVHEEVLSALYVNYGVCRKKYGLTDEQYREVLKIESSFSHRPMPTPFKGCAAVLRAVCEAGGKNYLYTHRNPLAWTYLRLFGLDRYFSGGVDGSMNFPSKPAPDAVEHICKVYSLDKSKTVMVGDREIDVRAAVNAGCSGCLFVSHKTEDLPEEGTCAAHTVGSMEELARALDIPLSAGDMLDDDTAENIRCAARNAALELCDTARLEKGDLVVVGCSSSEITGERIGSASSPEAAEAVLDGLLEVFGTRGINIAAQCCEHLNRALIIDKAVAAEKGYERVNVIPMPKAGGAFANAVWRRFDSPVAVSSIQADAGIDIGGTLIGMHLKKVAVPLRLSVKNIGEASVAAARVRAPFAGGERAVYDDLLM